MAVGWVLPSNCERGEFILTYEGHHTSFVQRGLTMGVALFIVSPIVVYILSIGLALLMYSGLFTNFLSILNLTYSAYGILVSPDWYFFLLCFALPVKPKPDDNLPKKRLTQLERQQFKLKESLKEVLFGNLLGDLYIQKDKLVPNRNPRLRFTQSVEHKDYIFHLFELLESYCGSEPRIIDQLPDKRTGKVSTTIYFITYSLPCFNELYELFYPEGKKIVPSNIGSLLTLTSLAY